VLRGIYDALDGSRYSIQLANTRYSILQEEKLLRLFLAQKPAGLIVTGIDQTPESRSILESVDCPIVQIMEIGENPVDMMIGFSHADACQAAISHLLAQGCRRIAFLGARMDPRVQRRFLGYQAAMKEAGLLDPAPGGDDAAADIGDARRQSVCRPARQGAGYRCGVLRQ
jgi:LacI family gluconate utilization system Gnt-I transcriptional repressor